MLSRTDMRVTNDAQGTGRGRGWQCFRCSEPGHFARDCPQRAKEERAAPPGRQHLVSARIPRLQAAAQAQGDPTKRFDGGTRRGSGRGDNNTSRQDDDRADSNRTAKTSNHWRDDQVSTPHGHAGTWHALLSDRPRKLKDATPDSVKHEHEDLDRPQNGRGGISRPRGFSSVRDSARRTISQAVRLSTSGTRRKPHRTRGTPRQLGRDRRRHR
jgi:hypothetical protein